MCYDQLAPCTAHEEQSNGWYGMASKQEQIFRVGNKFTASKKVVPREFVPHGTNSLGKKFPRNKFTGEQIPSYTGRARYPVLPTTRLLIYRTCSTCILRLPSEPRLRAFMSSVCVCPVEKQEEEYYDSE